VGMTPRKTQVDPADHIGVLHHVVKSMQPSLQEEALSEGLVLLVEAAQSYDAKYKIPPHYWIAKKLRWGLLNWKWREIKRHGQNESLTGVEREIIEGGSASWSASDAAKDLSYTYEDLHEARVELEALVALAQENLDDREYLAIFGPAWGLHMKELSHLLKANPLQIRALQESGHKRIQEMRLL